MPGPQHWTLEEDDIIREFWPNSRCAKEVAPMLPNRTIRAMRDRARLLGVVRISTERYVTVIARESIIQRGGRNMRAEITLRASRGAREALKAMGAM